MQEQLFQVDENLYQRMRHLFRGGTRWTKGDLVYFHEADEADIANASFCLVGARRYIRHPETLAHYMQGTVDTGWHADMLDGEDDDLELIARIIAEQFPDRLPPDNGPEDNADSALTIVTHFNDDPTTTYWDADLVLEKCATHEEIS